MPSIKMRQGGTGGAATGTNLTGLNSVNAVSVCFWGRLEPGTQAGDVFRQRSTANSGRDGYGVGFTLQGAQMRIQGATAVTNTTVATARFSKHRDGGWAHYAFTFDDATNQITMFWNGDLISVATNAQDMTSNASCTTEVGFTDSNGAFNGCVFDLQVYPEAVLKRPDVLRAMNPRNSVIGSCKGRWFGFGFRQPALSGTIYDESGNNNNLTATAQSGFCIQGQEPPFLPTYQ